MRRIPWSDGEWTHAPADAVADGDDLVVTAVEGSDAWRTTSYGFVHADEHALVAPLDAEAAVEVAFTADLSAQFDQAGLFLRVSDEHWVKAGVEYADGVPQVGVVVTDRVSDWSAAPVPEWTGRRVTIRASRSGDAVTVRARVDDEGFRFVRLLPLAPDLAVVAGPYLCAPTRAGLAIRFHAWSVGAPDGSLH
jgi:uncharacterized protein